MKSISEADGGSNTTRRQTLSNPAFTKYLLKREARHLLKFNLQSLNSCGSK